MKKMQKKRSVKKTVKHKKSGEKRVLSHTEILDFDLDEQIRLQEEKKKAKAERKAATEQAFATEDEVSRELSKEAVNGSWDTMPEKEVSLGNETMELLGLEELLDEVYPQQEKEVFDDAYSDTKSSARSVNRADYMDFVPKKTKRAEAIPTAKASGNPSVKKNSSKAAPKKKRKKGGVLAGFDVMDRIIAATGVLVVLMAILTAGIYSNAQSAKKQVEAMAEIGMKMESIGIAGEGIFTAVADARIAAQEAAEYAELMEVGEYEEKDLTTEVNVGLKLTSVQRDLKIKFTNKSSGKLIANQPFAVEIDGPEDLTKTDDDEDGIIYINSIKPGEYTVTITAPDEIDGNTVKGVSSIVTVKDQIEYKKIDVADEVKTESEINAAQEDTAVAVEVESVATDTVEWVESTKTAISGGVTYIAVNKSEIPDPSATARAAFTKIAAVEQKNMFSEAPVSKKNRIYTSFTDFKKQALAQSDSGVAVASSNSGNFLPVPLSQTTPETATPETTPETQTPETTPETQTPETTAPPETETTPETPPPETETTPETTPPPTQPVIESISISGPTTAKVNERVTLNATVKMSDGSTSTEGITWSDGSSGSSITLTSEKAETKTVKATASNGKEASYSVVFVADKPAAVKVKKISLDAVTLSLTAGESKVIKATAEPSDATDKKVEWSSSNTAIATVDANGTVKAVAEGTADITAKAKDGSNVSAVCKVTVKAAVALSVTLEAPGSLNVGEEKTLKGTVTGDIDLSKTTITSSDPKLATVDNTGKVKALAQGKVTITVKVVDKNGKEAIAVGELTINPAASVTIKLDPGSASVKVGEKVTIKAEVTTLGSKAVTWKSSDESLAKIVSSDDSSCVVEALKPGTVAITATSKEKTEVKAVSEIKITTAADPAAPLKDRAGSQLYVKEGDTYREATAADYDKYDTFYRKQDNAQYRYTGWQNIDGKRYYFDKNGTPVTGDHIIQGMQYTFQSDGSLKVNGAFGIDVSKHNGNIDWNAVKNAGVEFVIIRCGYRGSATGVLVEDPKFKANIQGAANAGLKVGIYFFSQAVNEVEAVEEASMTVSLINKYKITYPVYMDVEAANGRADHMDAATRTKVINAYCQTIRNSGYTAGVYANKSWLNSMFHVGALSSYKIWLAQYATTPTYNGRYEMWQYSSTGRIPGISEYVDLNMSYMTY